MGSPGDPLSVTYSLGLYAFHNLAYNLKHAAEALKASSAASTCKSRARCPGLGLVIGSKYQVAKYHSGSPFHGLDITSIWRGTPAIDPIDNGELIATN
jgi:hypothetical protein